jgi:hypothetical protein
MKVKPVDPNAVIRDPHTKQPLPAEGAEVPENSFWTRRLLGRRRRRARRVEDTARRPAASRLLRSPPARRANHGRSFNQFPRRFASRSSGRVRLVAGAAGPGAARVPRPHHRPEARRGSPASRHSLVKVTSVDQAIAKSRARLDAAPPGARLVRARTRAPSCGSACSPTTARASQRGHHRRHRPRPRPARSRSTSAASASRSASTRATANTIATNIAAAINANSTCRSPRPCSGRPSRSCIATRGSSATRTTCATASTTGEALPAGVAMTITAVGTVVGDHEPVADEPDRRDGRPVVPRLDAPVHGRDQPDRHRDRARVARGPMRMIDGVAITSVSGSFSTHTTLGLARNSQYSVHLRAAGRDPADAADGVRGRGRRAHRVLRPDDPARPFQTLAMSPRVGPAETDQWSTTTSAISSCSTASRRRSASRWRRAARARHHDVPEGASGAADTAYLDVTTPLTLMYLRYSTGGH